MRVNPSLVKLHPTANSGESVIAKVHFGATEEDRSMSLTLEGSSYGHHHYSVLINFDKPEHMLALAHALIDKALEAEKYFAANP